MVLVLSSVLSQVFPPSSHLSCGSGSRAGVRYFLPSMTSSCDSYNKHGTVTTRVGNWVEEEALKASTGETRYKPGKASRLLDTGSRCLLHSDAEPPREWSAISHSSYKDPSAVGDKLSHKKVGGKAMRTEREIRAEVVSQREEELAKQVEEESKMQLSSTSRSSFVPHGRVAECGRRIMKTQGGQEGARPDITYMVEAHTLPPVRTVPDSELLKGVDLNQPVTFYSQRLNENIVSMTGPSGSNPFARNTAFTNDIRDSRKIHAGAIDTPNARAPSSLCVQRTRTPGMRLSVLAVGEKVKKFLQASGDVNAYKRIAKAFSSLDPAQKGHVKSDLVPGALNVCGVDLTASEVDLLRLGHATQDGDFDYKAFLADVKGTIQPERYSLINAIFDSMSSFSSSIHVDLLSEYFIAENQPAVTAGQISADDARTLFAASWESDVVSKDEFINFYSDISVSVAKSSDFEKLVTDTWRAKPRSIVPTINVAVTRADGSITNATIEDPLEVIGWDKNLIKTRLRKSHNIHDAVKIEIL